NMQVSSIIPTEGTGWIRRRCASKASLISHICRKFVRIFSEKCRIMSPKINGIYYNEDKNFDSGRCKMSTLLKEIEPLQQALEDSFILFITDEQGMILYGNARLVQISQYAQDELIGQHVRMLKSKIHPPRFYQEIEKRIAAGKVWHDEICVRAKDGTEYWVDMTVIPVRSNREEKVQYLWFGRSEERRVGKAG